MTDEVLQKLLLFEDVVRTLIHGESPGTEAGDGGMEFDHLKPWEPGDATRDINRLSSYQKDEFIVNMRLPNRELTFLFVVDVSASMSFGSQNNTKIERVEKLLSKAVSLGKEEHPFFLLSYISDAGPNFIPLGIGESADNILGTVNMSDYINTQPFDVCSLLRMLKPRAAARTHIVLIFSDFAGVPLNYENEMRAFVRAGHKMCGIAVVDPLEYEMPSIPFGAIHARDAETGKDIFTAGSQEFLIPHKEMFHVAHSEFIVFGNSTTQEET